MTLFHDVRGRKEIKYFKDFSDKYLMEHGEIEKEQLNSLRELIRVSKLEIPYYDELFTRIKITPSEIKKISDLNKIPILTKEEILKNKEKFISRNSRTKFIQGRTGGSTGEPLTYRMSKECYSRGIALLYRGWSHAGYNIGDKVTVLAGGSMIKNNESIKVKINRALLNIQPLSSYGVSEETLYEYYERMNKWKPDFLRGYASSLALMSDFMLKNNLTLDKRIKGVFSTAEMLSKSQRVLIQNNFNSKVYNQYGLNDGGVSAFEDFLGEGFAIDTERSLLEVLDDNNEQKSEAMGRIIATSLYNYSFPFIRYETGDEGEVGHWYRNGKRYRSRLLKVGGRTTDYLKINNKLVGSPVLTVLMGKINVVKYQIIQENNDTLRLLIKPNSNYTNNEEQFIRSSLFSNLGEFNLIFDYSCKFIESNNKHKFIIDLS